MSRPLGVSVAVVIAALVVFGAWRLGSRQSPDSNTNKLNMSGRGGTHMSEVLEVTKDSFEQEVEKSDVPVLVDFWAPWCGPCRMLAPTVDELAGTYAGRLKVVKLNTDQNGEVAGRFGIRGIPTLIIFKDGKETERIVGVQPKASLVSKIDGVIGNGV
jgi:thioredoxin 1